MRTIIAIGILASFAACGSSSEPSKVNVEEGDPFDNYDKGNVNVIGADSSGGSGGESGSSGGEAGGGTGDVQETPVLVGQTEGDASETEICISETVCQVPPTDESNWCEREGGPVDLIYVDGELVDTICYPPAMSEDHPTEVIDGTQQGDIDVAQMANKTAVVFDESTNGTPFVGNVSVDGNNVSIYGNGPDNTIIDGDVALDGNNVRLRGVTITGDLIISKNRVAVVLCRILGNVRLDTMSTNGSVFAENDIFGSFISTSNGNLYVGNDVLGEWTHEGNDLTCDRNAAFTDEDGDELVDDDEHGELLECP